MCIMLTKPAGVSLERETMERCHRQNNDGCGYSVAMPNGTLVTYRDHAIGFKAFWERLQRYMRYPMLIHFRHGTSGGKCHANTHPFLLGKGHYSMAHNGIITIDKLKDESDTRAFIRLCIDPYIGMHKNLIEQPKWQEFAKNAIGAGNKLAFIRADGKFFYVGKERGTEDNGCWWSNTCFRGWSGNQTIGFGSQYQSRWMDDEYILADSVYEAQQAKKLMDEEAAAKDQSDMHLEKLYEEGLKATEDFLRDANIVEIEDVVCTVCNEYCNPPYLLDADTGLALCNLCRESYAQGFDLNDTIEEENSDAGTGTATNNDGAVDSGNGEAGFLDSASDGDAGSVGQSCGTGCGSTACSGCATATCACQGLG